MRSIWALKWIPIYLSIAFECLVSLKSFEQFLTSTRSVTICLNPQSISTSILVAA